MIWAWFPTEMRLITQVLDDGQVLILGIDVRNREVFRFYIDRQRSLNHFDTTASTVTESFLEHSTSVKDTSVFVTAYRSQGSPLPIEASVGVVDFKDSTNKNGYNLLAS